MTPNFIRFWLISRFLKKWIFTIFFCQFSGSSAFCKSSLNIWKFTVQVLLKPGLENFEHYFVSEWDDCNCAIALPLPFFGIEMKTDLFQSCGHCWVFHICWHIECSTFHSIIMYHNFCIHSPVDEHLGCFRVPAIVKSAAVNTGVHASLSQLRFSRGIAQ